MQFETTQTYSRVQSQNLRDNAFRDNEGFLQSENTILEGVQILLIASRHGNGMSFGLAWKMIISLPFINM